MWFVYPHKPINIILQVHINYNSFQKDYQKNYLGAIDKKDIRNKLNIPETDKLKKNGYWTRKLFYSVNNILRCSVVKIQKLQWTTQDGKNHYISVWPDFIIKYNPVSLDLIEFISTKVRKGEHIFKLIDDPECLIECEDLLSYSCQIVNQACKENNYSALLNANYTQIHGTFLEINTTKIKFYRYPNTYLLYKTAQTFYGHSKAILSLINHRFKFLR